MSASLIRIAAVNYLEGSTVVSAEAADAGFPLVRIYDRNAQRRYQDADAVSAPTLTVHGGTIANATVNALIIAGGLLGHTVGNKAYTLEKSANGTDWTTVSTGTTHATNNPLVIEFAETSAAGYGWKLTLPGTAVVRISELMLTYIITATEQADRSSSRLGKHLNISGDETAYGSERALLHGPTRRLRYYNYPDVPLAMADQFETHLDALGGVKPFFLCDHNAAWIWGNLLAPVEPQEIASIGAVCKTFFLDFREWL